MSSAGMDYTPVTPHEYAPEITRQYLRDWVLRRLGHPTVSVELTEEQVDDCIDDSLCELSPWVVQPEYITVPYSQRIDLTEHRVAYVINVIKASLPNLYGTGGYGSDPFALYPFTTYGYAGYTGGRCRNGGCSTDSTLRKQLLYGTLANVLFDKTVHTFKDDLHFKFIRPYLYLDVGLPKSTNVTIKFSPLIRRVEDLTEEIYIKFVKDFSLAFARARLADIRLRFTVGSNPFQLDGERQDSISSAELDKLRRELKDSVPSNFMID